MTYKISYSPLESDMKRITELVKAERFRSPDTFIDKALQILLTWESKNPERCMEIMKTMTPFTREQENFMKESMKEKVMKEHFRDDDFMAEAVKEVKLQESYSPDPDDYLKLRKNRTDSKKFVSKLEIKKPSTNLISYDGYPILFRFYSRFLPGKIVITVLGDLLRKKKSSRVKLDDFRLEAYDIALEISEQLEIYEKDNNVKRNEKISTGFPNFIHESGPSVYEKKAHIQKRFKEQYIGKVRKSRTTNKRHFEGVLAALGLVYVTEEKNELYLSFTEDGKDFYLLDNPVVNGDFSKPFSDEENDFIFERLIPKLELEKQFITVALDTVKKYPDDPVLQQRKMSDVLDDELYRLVLQYQKENPEKADGYKLDLKFSQDEESKRRVIGWRVATMGRLAELKLVHWTIDSSGDSVFSVAETIVV